MPGQILFQDYTSFLTTPSLVSSASSCKKSVFLKYALVKLLTIQKLRYKHSGKLRIKPDLSSLFIYNISICLLVISCSIIVYIHRFYVNL